MAQDHGAGFALLAAKVLVDMRVTSASAGSAAKWVAFFFLSSMTLFVRSSSSSVHYHRDRASILLGLRAYLR